MERKSSPLSASSGIFPPCASVCRVMSLLITLTLDIVIRIMVDSSYRYMYLSRVINGYYFVYRSKGAEKGSVLFGVHDM
jgi:hypothetical protein